MDYNMKFTDTTKPGFVVKPYTANGPLTPSSPTPLYGTAVGASTSLVILGKGAFDYGEPIQQNFISMLESFSNNTRPAFPIKGQIWYKNADGHDVNQATDPDIRGLYVYNGATWTQIFTAGTPANGDLDMGGYRISNVADATNDTDALNRQTGNVLYVNVTGDQMSGPLNMSDNLITNVRDATADGDALNRRTGDFRYVNILGDTMMGVISMNNNKITNLTNASNPQDALNLRTAQSIFISAGVGGSVDGGTY